jgi:hypothetical protein
MNTEQKGKLIAVIIQHLEYHAKTQKKAFDAGDTFFALAFKSDSELRKIAKLAGI